MKKISRRFNRMRKIQGMLFVHGFSFKEQDDPICDAIFSNKEVKRIYVGLFGDGKAIKARIEKLNKNNKLA